MIPRPAADFYILGMIAAPNRQHPPRQFLERDPGLLDDELWRLFQCEGSGELSLAAYDKYVQQANTWLEAFRAMAEDGAIEPRARPRLYAGRPRSGTLLRLCAGWFSRLHETLKPTLDRTRGALA